LGKIIDFPANHNYNLIINDLCFEWNYTKNTINVRKHGISFETAATAFFDEYGILINEILNSETEERFVLLGCDKNYELLVVCHCYRENESIRIISARKATKKETEDYRRNYEKRI